MQSRALFRDKVWSSSMVINVTGASDTNNTMFYKPTRLLRKAASLVLDATYHS